MHQLRADAATLIGRGLDADVRLEDDGVSRRHAKITLAAGADPVLEDMGSSNGTFVNGERIQKHALKDGDKVQIGSISILKFSYQDDFDRTFQQQLVDRGIKDGLTGIYNKKYFLDRIDSEYAHARRHKRDLSLLLFDIDNFKNINDSYGHPAGDLILKELTGVVATTLRTADVFVRYGGDEFIVMMRDIDDAGALVVAQRIRKLAKHYKFLFGGIEIPVTVSIGIGTLSDDMNDVSELVEMADKYLYRAKRAGRNCIGGRAVKLAARSDWSTPTVRQA